MNAAKSFSILLSLLIPTWAAAEIYTWTDSQGRVHFGDKPPVESLSRALDIETREPLEPPEAEDVDDDPRLETRTLWREPRQERHSRHTRITAIKFVRKTCNKLTLHVSYHNDGSLPGYLRISPNVSIPGQSWPLTPKLQRGSHTIEVQNGFQRDAAPAKSSEIAVAIEHIHNNTWQDYVDRRTVEYHTEWNNNCL